MSASSLSVAAAVGTCSNRLISSTPIDHLRRLSLCLVPFKAKPIKAPRKLISFLSYRAIPRSSIFCASTGFDSVGLNEEGPEVGVEETVSEVEEEDDDVSQNAEDGGRLYVGNIMFTMTSAQLSDMFAKAGRVVSVEMVYDKVKNRSRGFAFVTMDTVDEAKEAIRLFDGARIMGRTAKVNFPVVPRGGERQVIRTYKRFVETPYKIYAGNLSWDLRSQALKDVFAEQPGFLSAKVIYDKDSGKSRGFGFITFSSSEEVESALKALNGLEVEGRPLRLKLSEPNAVVASSVESMSENNLEMNEVFSSASS